MIPLADDYHPYSWTLITFLLQKNVCFIYWCWSTRPVFLQLPLPGSLFLYLSMLLRTYFSQVFFKLFLPWCPRLSSVACYALSHTGPAMPFIILTVLAINCSTWFPTNITNTNSLWGRSHVCLFTATSPGIRFHTWHIEGAWIFFPSHFLKKLESYYIARSIREGSMHPSLSLPQCQHVA